MANCAGQQRSYVLVQQRDFGERPRKREWDREPELKALKAQAAGVAARIEKELAKDDGEQHREAKDTKKQGVPPVPVKPQEAGEQNMTISEKLMRFNDRLAAKDRAASAKGVLQNKGKGL